ncbi:hypothetical protein [Niveispirillum irakense]|uniref:hypothetical protein n=1 Tax=Niveispirillum irakense TaxID=34011 RepID=UPI0004034482|nr:hypothetical protein [Niveispirillum irakense]
MSALPVLPQQPVPLDARLIDLTERHLVPIQQDLFDYMMGLRLAVDRQLASALAPMLGKPYPLGRCLEINNAVVAVLIDRLRAPTHPVEKAIIAFLKEGGVVRTIWGALRGRYFQNAMQFGSLYVDASNDTVTVTKPKVEILPLEQAGLEAIRDAAHFAEIAAIYWGATIYANVATPSLAPILPFISFIPGTYPVLQSATDYMIELLMRDGFRSARRWLETAPVPPPAIWAQLQERVPADLMAADPETGRRAAIAACDAMAETGRRRDMDWRDARVQDYLRIRQGENI